MPFKDKKIQKKRVRLNQNAKRKFYQKFKESNPCSDCDRYFSYWIMQHDHRPDEIKLFALSQRSASFGSKLFIEEMAKCDLLCANCHATRTYKRRNGNLV